MNNKLKYLLIIALISISSKLIAQANLEINTPSGCESSCSVTFSSPVEAGLSDIATITLTNNAGFGGNLTGTASLIPFFGCTDCTSCPDQCLYFSIESGATINLASGTSQDIIVKFNPTTASSVGPISIKLRITINNDDVGTVPNYTDDDVATPELDVDINIIGEVKKTVINYSIVMDRSGSMSILEGSDRRIDLLSDAVDFFLSLEQLRRQDLPDFEGDSVGMVRYDHEVDASYLALSAVTDDMINLIAKPLVDLPATNDINQLKPRGLTATGNAVIDAINTHFSEIAPTPRKKVMILFSDGFENTGSLVGDPAVANLLAARQDVNIYSIGMGSANMISLDQYSISSGLSTSQSFQFDVLSDPLALSSFFFKIYQNAVGLQSIIDPTYFVDLNDSIPVFIAEAWVTSSDNKVIFSINHPRDLQHWVNFQIITPSGKILSDGLNNGISTVKIEGRTHVIYESTFNQETDLAEYVGKWKLKATRSNNNNGEQNNATKPESLINIPIGFAAATLSNLSLELEAGTQSNLPGEELIVTLEIEDNSSNDNVQVEKIDVLITRPDGKEIRLIPKKDKFGTFVAKYPHTQKKGLYIVYTIATLKNSKGERSTRDALRHVVVSNQQSFTSNRDKDACFSCYYTKVIIAFAILLLILIVIIIIRKKLINKP